MDAIRAQGSEPPWAVAGARQALAPDPSPLSMLDANDQRQRSADHRSKLRWQAFLGDHDPSLALSPCRRTWFSLQLERCRGRCFSRALIAWQSRLAPPSGSPPATPTSLGIGVDWLFRPNEFLIDCLRDRSALSLVWVLHELARRARRSFFHAGPTKFFYTFEAADLKKPDAEADLLVVADGKAILCEGKSSWANLTRADIRKLVRLARRLRPDRALLAVMEEGSALEAEIAVARTEIEAFGIELEVLTWRPDRFLSGPYLPTG